MLRPSARVPVTAALIAGWRRLGEDPVRLLGSSAIALTADIVGLVILVQLALAEASWVRMLAVGTLRTGVVIVARSLLVAAVVTRPGQRTPPPRPIRIGIVEGVAQVAAALAVVLVLVPWLPMATAGVVQGAWAALPLAALAAVLSAWCAALLVRAWTFPAVLRVARGQRAHPAGYPSLAARIVVLAITDVARALGASVVVLALPAYAWSVAALDALVPPSPPDSEPS